MAGGTRSPSLLLALGDLSCGGNSVLLGLLRANHLIGIFFRLRGGLTAI